MLQKVLGETETAIMRLSEDSSFYSPGTALDESLLEFFFSKVACISWSRTLLKSNIIPGQRQEFYLYFKSANKNFKSFQNIFGRLII